MDENIIRRLEISPDRLEALNAILLNPDMRVIDDFLAVVAKYGTPEEINARAQAARQLPLLRERVGIYRWFAIVLGFVGIVVANSPPPIRIASRLPRKCQTVSTTWIRWQKHCSRSGRASLASIRIRACAPQAKNS